MSVTEVKKERTLDDVRNEYSQSAAKLGHLWYQIGELTKDTALLSSQMRDLNFEASKLQSAGEVK